MTEVPSEVRALKTASLETLRRYLAEADERGAQVHKRLRNAHREVESVWLSPDEGGATLKQIETACTDELEQLTEHEEHVWAELLQRGEVEGLPSSTERYANLEVSYLLAWAGGAAASGVIQELSNHVLRACWQKVRRRFPGRRAVDPTRQPRATQRRQLVALAKALVLERCRSMDLPLPLARDLFVQGWEASSTELGTPCFVAHVASRADGGFRAIVWIPADEDSEEPVKTQIWVPASYSVSHSARPVAAPTKLED